MQSSFSTICILLVLVQMAFAATIELGYDCEKEFVPEDRLIEVIEQAKAIYGIRHLPSAEKKLSDRYNGPPFRKSYLLWPVSRETINYERASKTPYRAVLDDRFQVFSVIMMKGRAVKECRMRDDLTSLYNYRCGGAIYLSRELGDIASQECFKITEVATELSPVRYDGPPFEGPGKQHYIVPIITPRNRIRSGSTSEDNFVVFSNKCTVVGVVTKKNDSFIKCERG